MNTPITPPIVPAITLDTIQHDGFIASHANVLSVSMTRIVSDDGDRSHTSIAIHGVVSVERTPNVSTKGETFTVRNDRGEKVTITLFDAVQS